MLFPPLDVSAVVGGGAPTLSTEKDCILTEYLAWHAGATFVYNYGLREGELGPWKFEPVASGERNNAPMENSQMP